MKKLLHVFKAFLEKRGTFIALFISILYALSGSLISLNRFWQYEVFYYDFGIFDKAIWEVSRFSLPIIDHMTLGEKIIFADHFSPSIFLLSPLFWIFPFDETLLVIQAVAVAASGFVLFLIGKNVIKNMYYSLAMLLCYFLFVGLQNAVITDFHEVTIATLVFMIVWFAIIRQKKILYFSCLIILLGCKETLFLLGISIAVAMYFVLPNWRKIAVITCIISIIWGLMAIKVIIPFFSGGSYLYQIDYAAEPLKMITSLFDNDVKRSTLTYSLWSFGFLPLLNPPFWVMLFQDFLVKFYGDFPTRWGLGFHYSALTGAIMAVSSLYSVKLLQTTFKIKQFYITIFVSLLILNSLFLYRVVLHGPFALSYNPAFYQHTKDFAFLDEALAKIPKDKSVMTQNNLVTHFTHQKSWHLVSDVKLYHGDYYKTKRPDYILIDNREGQNPNNYFGVQNMNQLLYSIKKDKQYKVFYNKGSVWIFKKN